MNVFLSIYPQRVKRTLQQHQLTGLGKEPSNLSACEVKTSVRNNWKGVTGTIWFTTKLPMYEHGSKSRK